MPDASRLDREHKVQRELAAVVALQLSDPEWERTLELGEKAKLER
jgi:hypothetical protein